MESPAGGIGGCVALDPVPLDLKSKNPYKKSLVREIYIYKSRYIQCFPQDPTEIP